MRSVQEFLSSLNDGRKVHYRGRLVGSVAHHPVLGIAARHAGKLFDYPARTIHDERLGDISGFYRVPKNSADLLDRHRLVYETTMFCNGVFNISQAIGSDALFALLGLAPQLEEENRKRVAEYFDWVARKDLTIAVAQTDVKGDRSKRPSEQVDRDLYLRVVDEKGGGIVVRGAKAHTTQAAVADEIIVIPTRSMKSSEEEYSVAFAVPANTPGLTMFVRPVDEVEGNTSAVLSRLDYELETLTVFEDVFVPWERVFLYRNTGLAGRLATLFANFHRFTAISYRSAMANLYLGAALEAAKSNGLTAEKHVRDDLLENVTYKELMRMSAIAASSQPLLLGGVAVPNPVYTNIGKIYSNTHFTDLLRSLIDISGGIIATLPSQEDLNTSSKDLIEKYMRGAVDGASRIKTLKLAKELGATSMAGYMLTLMIHAEGSIESSKIELFRNYDFSEATRLVNKILNTNTDQDTSTG